MNAFLRVAARAAILRLTSFSAVFVTAVAIPVSAASPEPRWTSVRTATLTVIGDQPASTLRDVAVQLEQFRTVVAGLIAGASRPPSLPTNVFVFGSRAALRPYLPIESGREAALAGFFLREGDVNTIALSLERMDESAAVAYHEYTHLLVGNAVRSIPVWLNEGLAEYYSTYRLVDGGREAQIGRPPEGRLALLRAESLPLGIVIGVTHSSSLYNESNKRSIFYAESWALTHYILTQLPNGGDAINAYVAATAEGRTPYEAFFAAFGRTPEDFDRLLRVYVQRNLFTALRFTFPDKLPAVDPGPGRTLIPAEANAWLGDLQRRVGREVEGGPRIDAAATAEPDVAITRLAAGLLRFAQQRTSEGLVEMERAAALAPDDFETQFLHGIWLLRSDPNDSARQSSAAIQALEHATVLRPDSSDALAWLAYAQMQNATTLPNARRSIEHAIQLAPGRAEFRLRWADIRILQGGYADARALLAQIAAVKTDQRAADGARERLDRLDAYELRAELLRAEAATRQRLPLREPRPGEERVEGVLTRFECIGDEVSFHVTVGDHIIVTPRSRRDAVEMRSYLDDTFTVACGPRPEPDHIYLTTRDGIVVAVEFLPPGFIP